MRAAGMLGLMAGPAFADGGAVSCEAVYGFVMAFGKSAEVISGHADWCTDGRLDDPACQKFLVDAEKAKLEDWMIKAAAGVVQAA